MRRWWERLGLQGIIVVSLPVAALLMVIVAGAYHQYLTVQSVVDGGDGTVTRFIEQRMRSPLLLARVADIKSRLDPEATDPPILRLVVPSEAWQRFQSTPLAGWDEWFPGFIIRTGQYQEIEFRKRGDRGIHYVGPQKSMTVKAPKGELVAGTREMVLSRKDPVRQFLVHTLQAEFEVLAPATSLLPVFVNDRYYGLFRALEPVDEAFLRRIGQLPGNIYRLDTFAPDEVYAGVERNGFVNERLWDRTAVNDRPLVRDDRSWFSVLADLRSSNARQFQRALARVDRRELASYLAFKLLIGDPFHNSDIHNQLWYQDPSSGLFHPIAWDLYTGELGHLEDRLPDLIRLLLRDPLLPARTLEVLDDALERRGVLESLDSLVEDVNARFGIYLDYADATPVPEQGLDAPMSAQQAASMIRYNAGVLREWIQDARLAISASSEGDAVVLDVQTRGRGAGAIAALRFDRPIHSSGVRLLADQNRNGILDNGDRPIPLTWTTAGRAELPVPEPVYPRWRGDRSFDPVPQHYRFFVVGSGGVSPTLEAVNAITSGPIVPTPWPTGEAISGGPLFHPWALKRDVGTRHVWRGSVHLTSSVEVGVTDTLVIEPGTVVTLEPDVSVVSRGPVRAAGTATHPIRFRAASPERPWGTVALQGRGADGSVFRHVRFEHGGGAVFGSVEYIGMVNVHLARRVVFDSVVFADNQRSDDAFHAVKSEVRISGSRFERANADAIDFDFSTGVIERSLFDSSANDAIDLMGSSPLIRGNHMLKSGDKGVSIGESSSPIVSDNLVEDGNIGMEIKDRSEPVLIRNRLVGNRIGLSAYAKNWRYAAGGFPRLIGGEVSDNAVPLQFDGKSRLTRPVAHAEELADIVERGTPVLEQAFSGEFWDGRREWFGLPGTEVDTDRWDLVVRGRGRSGGALSMIDWDLTDPEVTYHLLLEYRVSPETDGVFRAVGEAGSQEIGLASPADSLSDYRWEMITLPPDRYRLLEVGVEPPQGGLEIDSSTGLGSLRSGQVRIHRLSLYTTPEPDRQRSGSDPPP